MCNKAVEKLEKFLCDNAKDYLIHDWIDRYILNTNLKLFLYFFRKCSEQFLAYQDNSAQSSIIHGLVKSQMSSSDKMKSLKMLLIRDVNCNKPDGTGKFVLDYLIEDNDYECIEVLLQYGQDLKVSEKCLSKVFQLRNKQEEAFRLLFVYAIKHKVAPHLTGLSDGDTFLHEIMLREKEKAPFKKWMGYFLSFSEVSIDAVNNNGFKAFDLLFLNYEKKRCKCAIKLLIKHRFPNISNYNCLKPEMFSLTTSQQFKKDVFNYFKKAFFSVRNKNKNASTTDNEFSIIVSEKNFSHKYLKLKQTALWSSTKSLKKSSQNSSPLNLPNHEETEKLFEIETSGKAHRENKIRSSQKSITETVKAKKHLSSKEAVAYRNLIRGKNFKMPFFCTQATSESNSSGCTEELRRGSVSNSISFQQLLQSSTILSSVKNLWNNELLGQKCCIVEPSLGQESYGIVYDAVCNGPPCWIAEKSKISTLNHPNVVQFLDVHYHKNTPLLVTKEMWKLSKCLEINLSSIFKAYFKITLILLQDYVSEVSSEIDEKSYSVICHEKFFYKIIKLYPIVGLCKELPGIALPPPIPLDLPKMYPNKKVTSIVSHQQVVREQAVKTGFYVGQKPHHVASVASHQQQAPLSQSMHFSDPVIIIDRVALFLTAGDYGATIKVLEILDEHLVLSDDIDMAKEFGQGLANYKNLHYRAAKPCFNALFEKSINYCSPGNQAVASIYLGEIEMSWAKYKDAEKHFTLAIINYNPDSVAEKYQQTILTKSAILVKKGQCHRSLSQIKEAINAFKMAKEVAESAQAQVRGSKLKTAKEDELSAVCALGNILQSIGDYDQSFEYYKKSLKLAGELGDQVSIGWAHGNLGNAMLGLDQKDEALDHLITAFHMSTRCEGNPLAVGRAVSNLRTAHQPIRSLPEIKEHTKITLNHAIYGNDLLSHAYGNIGNVLLIEAVKDVQYNIETFHLNTPTKIMGHHNGGCAKIDAAECIIEITKPKELVTGGIPDLIFVIKLTNKVITTGPVQETKPNRELSTQFVGEQKNSLISSEMYEAMKLHEQFVELRVMNIIAAKSQEIQVYGEQFRARILILQKLMTINSNLCSISTPLKIQGKLLMWILGPVKENQVVIKCQSIELKSKKSENSVNELYIRFTLFHTINCCFHHSHTNKNISNLKLNVKISLNHTRVDLFASEDYRYVSRNNTANTSFNVMKVNDNTAPLESFHHFPVQLSESLVVGCYSSLHIISIPYACSNVCVNETILQDSVLSQRKECAVRGFDDESNSSSDDENPSRQHAIALDARNTTEIPPYPNLKQPPVIPLKIGPSKKVTSATSYQTDSDLTLSVASNIQWQQLAPLSQSIDFSDPASIVNRAAVFLTAGDYGATIKILDILDKHLVLPDDIDMAKEFGQGLANYKYLHYRAAKPCFNALFEKSTNYHSPGNQALASIYLGEIEMSWAKYKDAEKHFTLAITNYSPDNVAEKYQQTILTKSAVLLRKGQCHRSLSQIKEAINAFKMAKEVAESAQAGSKLKTAKKDELSAVYALGNILQSIGDYDQSFEYYKKSLKLAGELGDQVSIGWAHGNLGNAMLGLDQKDKALDHLIIAFHMSARYEGNPLVVGRAMSNLGNAYQALGSLPKAKEHYEDALKHAIYGNDLQGQGRACGNIGNIYMLLKEPVKAVHYYTETLRLSTDRNTKITGHHNRGCARFDVAECIIQGKKPKEL